MGGNLFAQHQQALRRRIAGQFTGQGLQHAGGAAGPGLDREQVRARAGRRPAAARARHRARWRWRGPPPAGRRGRTVRWRRRGRPRPGRRLVRQIGGDIGAAAGAAAHVALGGQPLIGQDDGLPSDPEFLGQGAAGRQASPGRQGAGQDAVTKVVEDGVLPGLVWREHGWFAWSVGPLHPIADYAGLATVHA